MPGKVIYPTAWINLYLLLDDFGQPEPDRLITLSGTPIELHVEKNAYTEADTVEVVLDLEDFPFDPRIIRGATVEAFAADAEQVDDAATFWRGKSMDELRQLALFAGVIDEDEATFDEKHRHIRLKGRDYTAFMLDAEMPVPTLAWVKDGKRLSFRELIRVILDKRKTTENLVVEVRGDLPEICPAEYKRRADKQTTSGKATTDKTSKRKTRDGETIWDVIQEIALEAGLIVYVDLDTVVIREPATIFGTKLDERRLVTYTLGSDVASLVKTRMLGRQSDIGVLVTSFSNGVSRFARSFEGSKAAASGVRKEVAASGLGASAGNRIVDTEKSDATHLRRFVVRGIEDQTQLQRIADQLSQLIRHHEMEGTLETAELVDSSGRGVQRIGYGDPLVLELSDAVQSIGFKPLEQQIQDLASKGYTKPQASKIALSIERLQVPFYVHKVSYDFSTRDAEGFKCSIDIRSRKQVDLTTTGG